MSSAGQAVGGVVGAVAGFFLGGGPTGALYGAQAGMMLGGLLHPPKGPTVDGPRLNDLSVQTSTYGAVIPRVYGAITVDGNVFWLENNSIKETITKKKRGGKGGGAKTTTRTYSYSATFAVGLCKGPVVGIRRLWIGANLVYDAGSSDTNTIVASNQAATGFRLYTGTDTQQPDARMQATLGVANTPAWRGLCYLVFYDLDLTKYGNSLLGAQVRAEVLQSGAIYTYPYTAFSGLSAYYWHSPVWDGTVYCSVAYFQHAVVASTDGLSWQQYAIPNGGATNYQGTASDGAGTLLAYGVNQVWRSTDHGVTWTGYSLPGFVGYTTQIVWNGTTFLAITDTGNFFTSPNGITWTAQTPPAGLGSYGRTLCWNGSMWFVRPTFGTGREIWSSPSGATGSWTLAYTMPGDFNNHNLCAVLNGRVLYMGMGTVASYGPCAVWSDDGASWSYHAMPQSGDSLLSDGTNFWTEHGGVAYYSADGITWTYWTGPALGTNYNGGYGNGFIVYLGNSGGVGFRITKQFASALPATLGAIVGAECLQSGLLAAGDIDVSALTSGVYGYRVASVGAIRAALEPLQAAWPFDVVQRGYVIRFVARGGSSVVTIPQTDLDARGAGASAGVQITTSREMDSQIPRKVTVQYLDLDREYNVGLQYAERLNTAAINAIVLDLPIVMTATDAAGKAEVLLYVYWLERYDVAVALPPTYHQLEPGDVVTLVTPEGNVSLRLTAVDYTSDGRVECRAKYANAAVYTPTAVGASPAVTGTTTVNPIGASTYVLLDVPLIHSAQSDPSFLAAMTSASAGWRGGALMQSTDAGSTWADIHDFGAPGSAIGTCSNSIGASDPRVIDNGSVLSVTLTQGALYSVTQLAMLNGANVFAYGADGRWELIAAQTCALVSGNNYTLRDLLRGRFGTEWAMSLHAAGDSLVLLDTTDVAAIAMSAGSIGLSFLYRGITVNRDLGTDSNRAFTYRGVNLRPLSPIALTGDRDSGNDWALSWIRRTRDGGEWRDFVDASLGEATEAYAIDVYADGSYAVVKRTITASSPSCVYASADQVADFGANQATLYLKLYQISATVGRGYPLTQSITR